jgi:curved DNA-binding protein CbpA
MPKNDYYKILGVSRTASISVIKKRYQHLAKKHHPDHMGDESLMIIINEAYEVLSNPSKRLDYDEIYRSSQATNPTVYRTNGKPKMDNQTRKYRTKSGPYGSRELSTFEKILIGVCLAIFMIAVATAHGNSSN